MSRRKTCSFKNEKQLWGKMVVAQEIPQKQVKIMELIVLTCRKGSRQSTMNQFLLQCNKQLMMKQHVAYPFSEVYYKYIQVPVLLNSPPDSKTPKIKAKERKPRAKKVRGSNLIMGRWSTEETLQYVRFLQENFKEFQQGGQSRRLKKTFVRMGEQIGSRDADQCRSHHQKMLNFRNTIPQIIAFFKDKFFQLVDWSEPLIKIQNLPENIVCSLPEAVTSSSPFKVTVENNRITIEIRESQIRSYNPFESP